MLNRETVQHRANAAGFVDDLQARGRYTFTRDHVREAFGDWTPATGAALRCLTQAGRIVRPRQGFYVIVPLEYRSAGAPPASWFIDDLMRYLEQPYYLGCSLRPRSTARRTSRRRSFRL